MKRAELLTTLKRVSPALGRMDFLPIMACLCFDGKGVTAYDDRVAMWTPCNIGLKGGIVGQVLLDFLGASTAEEVEFTVEESEVKVKMGRTRLNNLVLHPTKDFIFKPVEIDEGMPSMKPGDELLGALRVAQLSCGVDPSEPTRLGVTFWWDKTRVKLFASDNTTVTGIDIEAKVPKKLSGEVVIVPPRFLEVLVGWPSTDACIKLALFDGKMIVAEFESGTRLYAKTLGEANVDQFAGILKANVALEQKSVKVPSPILRCLDRACLLVGSGSAAMTELVVEGDGLTLSSSSAHGKVVERVKLAKATGDVTVKCSPDRLRRIAQLADEFTISSRCVAFYGSNFTHLVSVVEQ